jgi:hypothetical protein
MMELTKLKQPATESAGLRGSGWVVAGFYLFAAIIFTSWAMGSGGPASSGSHHTSMGGANSAATTGSAPAH